jgi:hypothetical protein
MRTEPWNWVGQSGAHSAQFNEWLAGARINEIPIKARYRYWLWYQMFHFLKVLQSICFLLD